MTTPPKGSHQLRVGRVSLPWSTYLLTFCTHERKPGLAISPVLNALREELICMETDSIWQPQALMIMPDHIHLCVILGDKLDMSKAMARLKSRTRPALRPLSLQWQAGYHDHRLRPDDPRLPFCHYLLMNPVKAGLVENSSQWPFQWWRPEVWAWFELYAQASHPAPSWTKDLP